jgi:FMN phosphatase YigB (HAD superfamily)
MKDLILDCDDVLLSWANGFQKYHDLVYGTNTEGVVVKAFNMQETFGCSDNDIAERVYAFNCSEHFSKLEPVTDAVEYVTKLSNDFRLSIVTKCGTDDIIKEHRHKNLINVFGNIFSSVVYVPEHQSKYAQLSLFNSSNVVLFVDDVIENVDTGLKCNLPSVVFEQPHNIDYKETRSDLTFIPSWEAIFTHIKGL